MTKRYIALFFGIIFISLGVAICNPTKLGVDPFNAFALGLEHITGQSVALTGLIGQGLILILVYFKDKSLVYIGTLYAMLCMGFYIHMFGLLIPKFDFPLYSFQNLTIFFLGVGILCLGGALAIESDLGLSPYDGLSIVIKEQFKIPYFFARMSLDITFALIAFAIGGPVQTGTIIFIIGTGPIIQFFRSVIHKVLY